MISNIQNLKSEILNLKSSGLKIVLVTGVFDILHAEHKQFLKKAKSVGDFLLVGVETDERVRAMKGPGRPLNPQSIRLQNLSALSSVDLVFLLPQAFHLPVHHDQLIRDIRPDILAVSSHTSHQPEKQKILAKYGGRVVVVHPHNPSVSTTQIIHATKAGAKIKP